MSASVDSSDSGALELNSNDIFGDKASVLSTRDDAFSGTVSPSESNTNEFRDECVTDLSAGMFKWSERSEADLLLGALLRVTIGLLPNTLDNNDLLLFD